MSVAAGACDLRRPEPVAELCDTQRKVRYFLCVLLLHYVVSVVVCGGSRQGREMDWNKREDTGP